jgi:hypothetical protein
MRRPLRFTARVAVSGEPAWEREWRLAEAIEELEAPHRPVAASLFAVTSAGLATLLGTSFATDQPTAIEVAAAVVVAAVALAVVPAAIRAARMRVHLVLVAAALLSAGAAAVHFAVIRTHFDEWWGYGVFFVVSGLAQLAWSLLVVARPSRGLFWLGVAGNAAIVALWIVTRTVGTLIGPAATDPESVGFADVTATVFEALLVVGGLLVVRRGIPKWRTLRAGTWIVGLLTLFSTALALVSVMGAATSVIPPTE